MKKYADIASFDDFRFEKERLVLKKKISETRIRYGSLYLRKSLTGSNLLKEILFPASKK